MKNKGDTTDEQRPSGAPGEAAPSGGQSAAPMNSATAKSHTVSGGHYPPQPLNFPPDVNQGPGWKVPKGPYRPLPSSQPPSSPQKAPDKDSSKD